MQPTKSGITNYGLSASHFSDLELSKIRSFEKRQELFNILHSEDACHYERLYLVGFLKYVGYSLEEICAIIDQEACWGDYDAKVTWLHVKSLWRGSKAISSQFTGGSLAAGGALQSATQERVRPCAEKWMPCQACPDLVDHKCRWVTYP